jgi:orotidine-5'-phosphate decarboxylase
MPDKLIVALDVDSRDKAMDLVGRLSAATRYFKVGLELFSACGPAILDDIKREGCSVFLDLKLMDIPTTVAKAARVLAGHGVGMINVHASGGHEMMANTMEAVKEEARTLGVSRPKVIAVTVLTSQDNAALKAIGVEADARTQVLRLAALAKNSGVDGVVASPEEASGIRSACGKDFLIVTPGVRPSWAGKDDQKRVATPKEAISSGADHIVVGRPITGAPDPLEAARRILSEIAS